MRSAEAALKERRTPRGRDFERRMIKLDCNILSVGAIGLLLASPWLLVPAAVAHLAVGLITSPIKGWSLLMTGIHLAAIAAIVGAVTWLSERTAVGVWAGPLFGQPSYVAASGIVVLFGILGMLFAHPGGVDELLEFKNKYGDTP